MNRPPDGEVGEGRHASGRKPHGAPFICERVLGNVKKDVLAQEMGHVCNFKRSSSICCCWIARMSGPMSSLYPMDIVPVVMGVVLVATKVHPHPVHDPLDLLRNEAVDPISFTERGSSSPHYALHDRYDCGSSQPTSPAGAGAHLSGVRAVLACHALGAMHTAAGVETPLMVVAPRGSARAPPRLLPVLSAGGLP